jgi:nucleoside-diphosphate-sugar epimerase
MSKVRNLEYTYVVTGPYADAGGMYMSPAKPGAEAAGSYDVKGKCAILIADGNGRISLTTMRDVGKLVVATLLHPEVSKNKALKVNSFTTTPNEIVKEFERQTGDKWDVTFTPMTKLKELERDSWEKQNPKATVYTLRRIWAEGGTLYDQRDNGVIECEDNVDTLRSGVAEAIRVQTSASL